VTELKDEIESEASRPRPGFLVAAGVCILSALGAYFFEEQVVASSGGGQLSFAILLVFLVLASMGFVMCYRSPRLGNKLLGYDVIISKPNKGVKSDVQFSAGFKADTGADTKRMNSKRKQARYSRRKLAQVTREMQQDAPSEPNAKPKK